MDKVFRVELSGNKDRCCELELPAAYYGLLDALDKLQMVPGDKPHWEFLEHNSFQFLHTYLVDQCDLYQLNALAARLGRMDGRDAIAFAGLFQMEVDKQYGPISIATIVDLAYSTDCCHVVHAATDEQLGKFYAENGMIPEIEDIPDSLYAYLDFEKLGREARLEEGGVFAHGSYVVQHTELKPVYDSLDLTLKPPTYAIRLMVGKYNCTANGQLKKQMEVDLPATQDELDSVLQACGHAASWDEMVFWTEDGAIPALLESMDCDDIRELNELAKCFQYREGRGELPKLKAVILGADCHDAAAAVHIAETLENYRYEPEQRTAEEVAVETLQRLVGKQSLPILMKHIHLVNYGMEVIDAENAVLTPYGLVARGDGEPMFAFADMPDRGGMQMQ